MKVSDYSGIRLNDRLPVRILPVYGQRVRLGLAAIAPGLGHPLRIQEVARVVITVRLQGSHAVESEKPADDRVPPAFVRLPELEHAADAPRDRHRPAQRAAQSAD